MAAGPASCPGSAESGEKMFRAAALTVIKALSHGNRRDLGGHTMREDLLESPSTHKRLAHPSTHSTILILPRG